MEVVGGFEDSLHWREGVFLSKFVDFGANLPAAV